MASNKKSLTVNDIITELENEESSSQSQYQKDTLDIVLLPPINCNDDMTDEDSGDEDHVTIDNLPRSQLVGPAEVFRINPNLEEVEFDSEDDIPISVLFPKKPKTRTANLTWVQSDTPIANIDKDQSTLSTQENLCKSPVELFELFFSEDLFEMIVKYTNLYAERKNNAGNITVSEMKCFFAILILSGYSPRPRRRMYWESTTDANQETVSNALSRNRFEYILCHLHVCDNENLDPGDSFSKIRPLIKAINEKCIEQSPLEEDYSVDESMVPYYGRHGAKQFIKCKPIRWGYKLWTGSCSKGGYIAWFEPYQGAKHTHCYDKYEKMGLGAKVVLTFADLLLSRQRQISYHLYFDNFFSSLDLFAELSERGIHATGTIRDNRLKNCILRKKDLKRTERGYYEHSYCPEIGALICKWNDNSPVTLCTNFWTAEPTQKVKRFSQKDKQYIMIDQPKLISYYNKNMGGVDRADQNISLYRVSIRSKKWYFPLIAHIVDLCECNAWQLHKKAGGNLDHLVFRRRIALAMVETNASRTKRGPSRHSQLENVDSRYDRIDHFPESSARLRCRVCHKTTVFGCEKCKVALHVTKDCFKAYHMK